MAEVTGLTKAKMLEIYAASIISGAVVGGNLILTRQGGATINAGSVQGPQGVPGPPGTSGDLGTATGVLAVAKGGTGSTTATLARTALGIPSDPVAATAGIRTLGTGAQQAAAGNHVHAILASVTALKSAETPVGAAYDPLVDKPYWQVGRTNVVISGSSGVGFCAVPTAFPNGVGSFFVISRSGSYPNVRMALGPTLNGSDVVIQNTAGAAAPNGASVGVTYMALGW